MGLSVSHLERAEVFVAVSEFILQHGFHIVSKDIDRPWGGFFVIEEGEAKSFAKMFFPKVTFDSLKLSDKLSPKILVVAPSTRTSWQYHHRRAEIWRVVDGEVSVVTSETDVEGDLQTLKPGDQISLHQGERHRLVGLGGWCVLAEIWQHIDINNPSNEDDIVRVQDDFGR